MNERSLTSLRGSLQILHVFEIKAFGLQSERHAVAVVHAATSGVSNRTCYSSKLRARNGKVNRLFHANEQEKYKLTTVCVQTCNHLLHRHSSTRDFSCFFTSCICLSFICLSFSEYELPIHQAKDVCTTTLTHFDPRNLA